MLEHPISNERTLAVQVDRIAFQTGLWLGTCVGEVLRVSAEHRQPSEQALRTLFAIEVEFASHDGHEVSAIRAPNQWYAWLVLGEVEALKLIVRHGIGLVRGH